MERRDGMDVGRVKDRRDGMKMWRVEGGKKGWDDSGES